MMRLFSRLVLSALSMAITSTAYAGQCTWITPPAAIDFGNYSVFGAAVSTTRAIAIRCTPNTTGIIKLNKGTNSALYDPRTLKLTTATTYMNYNLNTAASGPIWGDGTGGSTTFEQFNGTPQDKTYDTTIFATVFANSDVPPGTYTDTVTATLSWGSSQSDARTFTISATVIPECTVSTFSISFGNYDPVVANRTTPLDSTSQLNVYCTKTTTGLVSLGPGSNASGTTRRMKKTTAAEYLRYEVYKDLYSTVWNAANQNTATSTSKLIPLGSATGFRAYGRVFAGQDVSVGTYRDTLVATVNY